MELGVDLGDLALDVREELAQGTHTQRVGLGQLESVELGLPDRPPQLAHEGEDPVLRHHAVDLRLGAGAVPAE